MSSARTGNSIPADVVAKVVKMKLEDPSISHRDFEKMGIVSKSSAGAILRHFFGSLDKHEDWVKAIVKQDTENLALGGLVVQRTLEKAIEKGMGVGSLGQIASVMSDATKRSQLFTGGATENLAVGVKTYLPEKED